MAIDMWSLGLVLTELFNGYPLVPGENEHEQLSMVQEIIGKTPKSMIKGAKRSKLFYKSDGTLKPY
jgi:dual specificity tyrosine-phosphorylation-regulated kinase 2/3/4